MKGDGPGAGPRARAGSALSLSLAVALAGPAALHASPEPDRVRLSGNLALTAKTNRERVVTNVDNEGYSVYNAIAVRLNADFQLGDNATVMTELFSPSGYSVRLYGAYLRLRDLAGTGIAVQAGKIPAFFGGYSQYLYGGSRTLIGQPLIYQYHTVLSADLVPADADELIAWKRSRAEVFNAVAGGRLPLLYERCWDTGIEVFGATSRLEASFGVTTGTLSNPLNEDRNSGKQLVGRVALLAGPGARVGVSAAHGAYLNESAAYSGTGAAKAASDFEVESMGELSLGLDLEWGYRHLRVYGELVTKRWESPYISGDLGSTGYHLEARYTLAAGLYAAINYGEMLFDNITRGDGVRERWDYSIRRVEVGGGYHLSRRLLLRGSVQVNDLYGFDDDDVEGALPALQLDAGF